MRPAPSDDAKAAFRRRATPLSAQGDSIVELPEDDSPHDVDVGLGRDVGPSHDLLRLGRRVGSRAVEPGVERLEAEVVAEAPDPAPVGHRAGEDTSEPAEKGSFAAWKGAPQQPSRRRSFAGPNLGRELGPQLVQVVEHADEDGGVVVGGVDTDVPGVLVCSARRVHSDRGLSTHSACRGVATRPACDRRPRAETCPNGRGELLSHPCARAAPTYLMRAAGRIPRVGP